MSKVRRNGRKNSVQAFRLVGKFLYRWGAIESLIAASIKDFLKMSGPEPDIILANITFRDKASILSTLITMAYGTSGKVESDISQRLFVKILNFNTAYRNVLAHHPFQPIKGGIEIKRVIAKGTYSVPKLKWDSKFFEQRFSEIDSFEEQINRTVAQLKRRDGIKRIAKALSTPSSNAMSGWLGGSLPAHLVSSGFIGPPLTLGLGSPLPLLAGAPNAHEND